MRELKVYCDECKRSGPIQIVVNTNYPIGGRLAKENYDFCDRLCLIRYFEKNPSIFAVEK